MRYTLRGKKSSPVSNNGLVNFVVKGRYDVDQEFKGVSADYKFSKSKPLMHLESEE